jgi:integrase
VRARLKKQHSLKLKVRTKIAKAFSPREKQSLMDAAREAKSPMIYPALMLALNAGMRSGEIRELRWEQIDLERRFLIVGKSKTEAGEGRTIPLNPALYDVLQGARGVVPVALRVHRAALVPVPVWEGQSPRSYPSDYHAEDCLGECPGTGWRPGTDARFPTHPHHGAC